jgi:phage tail P2-like protein
MSAQVKGASDLAQDTSLLVPTLRRDANMRAQERLVERLSSLSVRSVVVHDFDNVDASALNHLAEQFGLLDIGWELAETEAAKRAMLKSAIEIQRHRGTVWAVRHVFRLLGLGEIDIQEGRSGYRRDGMHRRDGFTVRGERSLRWAEYRIHCHRLLTLKQAVAARRLLDNLAPKRNHLVEINFSEAALIRNGFARRDGTYSRGSA